MIQTAHRHITTAIPAPETEEMLQRLGKVEPRSMHGQLPIVWADAEGHTVWDLRANAFIDFTSGIFVASIGHANQAVWDAIAQAQGRPLHSYTFATQARVEYLEALTKWSGFEKAFLVSSGTEATETALRIMRARAKNAGKRRPGIICIEGAFHGRTLGAQLMNGRGGHVIDPNMHYLGVDDFGSQIDAFYNRNPGIDPARDLCGVMVETFEGWSARFHPQAFIHELEGFCRENSLLLCFDEMQAGFARTGRKFGFYHYLSDPDLICVGKAMGGGLALSGVLGSAELMDTLTTGDMSSTHGGNPLACIAGAATLAEIVRANLVHEADRKGAILAGLCKDIENQSQGRVETFGAGLIRSLVFNEYDGVALVKRIVQACYREGLLLIVTGRNSIKIGPPLTIPDDALEEGMAVLATAVQEELWRS